MGVDSALWVASPELSRLFIRSLISKLSGEELGFSSSLALHCLRTQLPCSSVDEDYSWQLVSALNNAFEDAERRGFALDIIPEIVRQVPLKILQSLIVPIGQKVLSEMKTSLVNADGRHFCKSLLVMGSVVASGRGLNWEGTSEAALLDSLLNQVANMLQNGTAVKEAALVLRACIEVRSSAVRKICGKVKDPLWKHLAEEGAQEAVVGVVACGSERGRLHDIIKVVERVTSELNDLISLIEMFGRGEKEDQDKERRETSSRRKWTDDLRGSQIVARYDALCRTLTAVLSGRFVKFCAQLPICSALKRICDLLETRAVTQFTTPDRAVRVDHKTVAIILPSLHLLSLKCLERSIKFVGRAALLPTATRICRSLSSSILVPRRLHDQTRHAASLGPYYSASRPAVYRTASTCIQVFGTTAVYVLARPMCEAVIYDLEIMKEEQRAHAMCLNCKGKRKGTGEKGRAAKRRRKSWGDELEVSFSPIGSLGNNHGDEQLPQPCTGVQTLQLLTKACVEGIRTLKTLFDSRAIFSDDFAGFVGEVEAILAKFLTEPQVDAELKCAMISTITAAVRGGGSGRMNGLLSSSFQETIKTFQSLSMDCSAHVAVLSAASYALAECDSVVHPSGPSIADHHKICRSKPRPPVNVRFADEAKSFVEDKGTAGVEIHEKTVTFNGESPGSMTDDGERRGRSDGVEVRDAELKNRNLSKPALQERNESFTPDKALSEARSIRSANELRSVQVEQAVSEFRENNLAPRQCDSIREHKISDSQDPNARSGDDKTAELGHYLSEVANNDNSSELQKGNADVYQHKLQCEDFKSRRLNDDCERTRRSKPSDGILHTEDGHNPKNVDHKAEEDDTDALIASLVFTGGPDKDEPSLRAQ